MIQDLMSESQNHLKNLNNSFKKYLDDIQYPSKQEEKDLWDISGILKNRLNQKLKFDTRPIKKEGFKIGNFKSKADKMVFHINKKWIIIDVKELHNYIKKNDMKDVNIKELISNLDWNIIL